MQELLNHYNTLCNEIAQLKSQAQQQAKLIIAQGVAEYFKKHGDVVRAISWVQYTPFFNDGEACTFSAYGQAAYLHGVEDEDEPWGEGSKYYFDYDQFTAELIEKRIELRKAYDADPVAWSKQAAAERNALNKSHYFSYDDDYFLRYPPENLSVAELNDLLHKVHAADPAIKQDTEQLLSFFEMLDEDILMNLFGDGVRVIITAKETIVEEYMHD